LLAGPGQVTGAIAAKPPTAYCAVVLDVYSRRVVGWPIADHLSRSLEPRNVNRSWYAIRSRAGLTGFRLHDLRDLCASFMLAAADVTSDGDEDPWAQPDRADYEHLQHVLPEIERAAIDAAARVIFE
jgi:integrase